MTIEAILGAIVAVAAVMTAILKLVSAKKSKEQAKAEGLAKVEADETDLSIARVDAEYQRLRDSGK